MRNMTAIREGGETVAFFPTLFAGGWFRIFVYFPREYMPSEIAIAFSTSYGVSISIPALRHLVGSPEGSRRSSHYARSERHSRRISQ